MSFTVTAPTSDEVAEINKANPSKVRSTTPPADGYVRGTEVAKVLNELLVAAGRGDKCIPSQMVYNYAKKGYIETDEQHYPHIKAAVAEEWVKLQYARRIASEAPEVEVETDEDSNTDNSNDNDEAVEA